MKSFLIGLLVIFLGCAHEEQFEFPLVQTGDVVNITEEGVVFHGKIMSQGNFDIIEHGFVWDDVESDPSIDLSYRKSIGELDTDVYQLNLDTGLDNGKVYHVRAFVHTADLTVYGRAVSFISRGSSFPLSTIGPWTTISKFPHETSSYSGSFTIGNKAYVGVGDDGISFWEYEPLEDVWRKKVKTLSGRIVANFATSTKGYFLNSSNHLYQFDPINDSWSSRTSFTKPYYEDIISGFSIENKGYVVTSRSIKEYDEITDSWERIMATPHEMREQGAGKVFGFIINSKCYLVAATAPLHRARIYEFEPEIKSIKEIVNLNLYFSEAFEIEGKIYLVSSTRGLIEYDPINGNVERWTFSPYHQRQGAVSFSLGNKGYIGLGKGGRKINSRLLLDDFWEFDKSKLE